MTPTMKMDQYDDCDGWKISCESVSVGDEKVKIEDDSNNG